MKKSSIALLLILIGIAMTVLYILFTSVHLHSDSTSSSLSSSSVLDESTKENEVDLSEETYRLSKIKPKEEIPTSPVISKDFSSNESSSEVALSAQRIEIDQAVAEKVALIREQLIKEYQTALDEYTKKIDTLEKENAKLKEELTFQGTVEVENDEH